MQIVNFIYHFEPDRLFAVPGFIRSPDSFGSLTEVGADRRTCRSLFPEVFCICQSLIHPMRILINRPRSQMFYYNSTRCFYKLPHPKSKDCGKFRKVDRAANCRPYKI